MKLRVLPPVFRGRLHDARTATSIGRWLGPAFALCFVTGLVSHFMQHPPIWLADRIPSRPSWGYRVTQGLHVASGIAAIPLLLAKLWTVYPRLFEWPPLRSARHALERLSVAVLVAGAVFELATGLLNTVQWYPWPFSFVPVHYAVAWLVTGALVLHIAVKAPDIRAHWGRRSPGTLALPAQDAADRRSFLAAVGAAVGAVTLTTVGQSFTPLKDLILFAPRHPDRGLQALPVNRTAAAAGVGRVADEQYRPVVAGPRPPYTLTLDELLALPQHEGTADRLCGGLEQVGALDGRTRRGSAGAVGGAGGRAGVGGHRREGRRPPPAASGITGVLRVPRRGTAEPSRPPTVTGCEPCVLCVRPRW